VVDRFIFKKKWLRRGRKFIPVYRSLFNVDRMAIPKPSGCRQDPSKKYDRMRCVHHLSSAYMYSRSHGSHRTSIGLVLAQHAPSRMPSAVKEAAIKELEGRTGETDSEPEH
jgi:hypothetical protein